MLLALFSNDRLPYWFTLLAAFACSFALATALVFIAIRVCRRQGWTAQPRADRWHRGAPCLFGGVPLWIGFVAGCAIFLPWSSHRLWMVIGISSSMLLLGLVDDVCNLRPRTKLFVQLAAATLTVSFGVVYPLRAEPVLNVAVSILWIVGLTNAFNLLDNMDGLAGGIAIIAALYLALFYFRAGLSSHVIMLLVFAGASTGFLLFNFKPARIFMGDTGSLFLGFLLGCASLLDVTHLSGISAFLCVPVLVLAIPVFDTFFVSVTRRLRGSRISQGGTDHSSHRLVKLGLNERSAVLFLYVLSAGSGAVALFLRRLNYQSAVGVVGFWFLFLLIFGVHLFQRPHDEIIEHKPPTFVERLLSRDVLAVVLDPLVLLLAYYLAYLVRFRDQIPGEFGIFVHSWALVLAIKFVCLWASGVYRRSWWRGSRADLYCLMRAVCVGEVITVLALTGLHHFGGYSRLVFVLDAALSWALLSLMRYSFRGFHDLLDILRGRSSAERRVFLIGTSELTQVALRFLRQNNIDCVGLIDNNGGGDLGRHVWGMNVIGTVRDIGRLAETHGVREVILPENETIPVSEAQLAGFCRDWRIRLTKLGLYDAHPHGQSDLQDVIKPRLSGAA